MQDKGEELFIALWLICWLILWYFGFAMWLSVLIGFFIALILGGLLRKFGYNIIKYDIKKGGQLLIDLPIKFTMPFWKKFLSFFVPVKPETLKTEIRYLYKGGNTWPHEAIWKETKGTEITITEERVAHIAIWQYENHQMVTLAGKLLPSKFSVDVRIKRVSDDKIRTHFTIPLEVD